MALGSDIAGFYQPPNEVNLDVLPEELIDLVHNLAARMAAGERSLLPALTAGVTRWYGFAPDPREGRLLAEEMEAWLAPPIGARVVQVDTGVDAVDDAACRVAPNGVLLRVDVATAWRSDARANVRSLLDAWQTAPQRGMDMPRPVGRVLRDFYEALGARDRVAAQAAVDEIKSRCLLSAANAKFLRVQLIGTLGSPLEMLDDPQLADITEFRRPPAVTRHLAEAADALFISSRLSDSNESEVAWAEVAVAVEDAWPGLVSHPSQIGSLAAARCLALSESLATEPRHLVYRVLEAKWSADPVVAAVLEHLRRDVSVPTEATIVGLCQRGEFESVLDLADRMSLSGTDAVSVLHASFNLGDAQSAARAVALVDRMDGTAREQLLSQAVEQNLYRQLVDLNAGQQVPRDWPDWLTGDWPDRPDVLNEWAAGWDRTSVLDDGWADDMVLALMDALAGVRRGRTRNGLPILVNWLCDPGGLLPGAVGPAVTILDVMLDGDGGRSERRAALRLAEEVLRVGCSADEFAEVAAALRGVLSGLGSREADWLIEALDVLIFSTVPDEQPRRELLAAAHGIAVQWTDRLTEAQAILLAKLFAAAGLDFPLPPSGRLVGEARRRERSFRRVGIYSLAESAAKRARQWIVEQWPDVSVTLAHEHVNSERLEAMARNCDVVVVQTSHAKHAAVAALEAATTPGGTLLRVHGRGATSLVRALLERAAEAA